MSNVASLELSKKLRELSGWEDTRDFYHEQDNFNEETERYERNGKWVIVERKRADYNIPAYDCGYLLRRLPATTSVMHIKEKGQGEYEVYFISGMTKAKRFYADTPEDALCKLAIKLFEEGVLYELRSEHDS